MVVRENCRAVLAGRGALRKRKGGGGAQKLYIEKKEMSENSAEVNTVRGIEKTVWDTVGIERRVVHWKQDCQ